MKHSLVQDWMSTDIITIEPDTPLRQINALMVHQKVRHLPVMQNGQIMGIVSQGDMRSAVSLSLGEDNYTMLRLVAEEIMTPNPMTISSQATVGQAAQVMLRYKINGLPVVGSQDKLVGIITESDILRLVVQEWNKIE